MSTDTRSYGELVMRRANHLRERGDASSACRDFSKAYNLLKNEGRQHGPIMRDCLHMWGVALCSYQQPGEGLERLRQALSVAMFGDAPPSHATMAHIMRDQAKAYMLLGEFDQAEQCLHYSQDHLRSELQDDVGLVTELGMTIGYQGRLEAARGNRGLALIRLREADRMLRTMHADKPRLYNLLALARVAHQDGQAEAYKAARQAFGLARDHGGRQHRLRALLLMLPVCWRLEAKLSS
jgi:tetratricopeptide (TPR) repeat protein